MVIRKRITIISFFLLSSVITVARAETTHTQTDATGGTVFGTATILADDTMLGFAHELADAFEHRFPDAKSAVIPARQGGIVASAIRSRAGIVLISRPLNPRESDALAETTHFRAFSPGAMGGQFYVNAANPLQSISAEVLSALFARRISDTLPPPVSWSDLGLTGPWNLAIILYALESTTPSTQALQQTLLNRSPLAEHIQTFSTTADFTQAIAQNPGAAGFGPAGIAHSQLRTIPITGLDAAADNSADVVRASIYVCFLAWEDAPEQGNATAAFLKFVATQGSHRLAQYPGWLPAHPEEQALIQSFADSKLQPAAR